MTTCPNPGKSRYATRLAADNAAQRVDLRAGLQLRAYECVCTWWHLTKDPAQELINPADASPHVIERLVSIPDIDFREIVAADIRGAGDPDERAALRHRRNHRRWKEQLGELIADIETQLRDRRASPIPTDPEWRRRATAYRDRLVLRLTECRRLRAEAHEEEMRRGDARRRDAERAAEMGATPKKLRAEAGEIAVDRLVTAHREEFERYLVEEYQALGLTIPPRFEKWVREPADNATP
ncbi:hypothetical protein TR631_33710 [Streptomyces rochei]|uniref:hypothetical protein n=1 Tax=Streptomyces rochei TaxID=1928 RepID=UPI002ACE7511|nr:hypothetical protein [Streptomyces rochei]WQC16520.1 hypothetical protein TR631_33710 [Streptomyces rochei]